MDKEHPQYSSIVTHFDLDGVASAALCSYVLDIDQVTFTGPSSVTQELVDLGTVVCDLPYPRECGLWFDHHMANQEELKLRQIDMESIPGKLEDKPSCLHVVYDHFVSEYDIEHWQSFVKEVDDIDGFLYITTQEWRTETPAKIIDFSIKYDTGNRDFLRELVFLLRESDYTYVARLDKVLGRARAYQRTEESQIELIKKSSTFLNGNKQIVLIDLTGHHNPPNLQKNLAFTFCSDALAVLEVRCQYERGLKTNNLNFSMSLGLVDHDTKKTKDVGEIMRLLNIGDGHPGAAGGYIACTGKIEREKVLQETLERIGHIWNGQ